MKINIPVIYSNYRLDRLFILLESGSSVFTRRAAAKQIGEVQKLHPHELHNLLNRLTTYLRSTNWDTRVAAALAVQAILENVPQWTPKPLVNPIKVEQNKTTETLENTRLTFSNFDLNTVLHKGARLLGSEGTEFDVVEENDGDLRERLIRQRAMLSEKLGLSTGIKIDELITMEDMVPKQASSNNVSSLNNEPLIPVQEILYLENQSLSSREINRAKRKARQTQPMPLPSPSSRRSSCSSMNSDEPERKRIKQEIKDLNNHDPVPDATGSWGNTVDWPLETFCSKLYVDLFNPKWEIRHGAATALREFLKAHALGAGKSIYMTKDEMEKNHQLWLEDAALRLLCVIALDRFGDFVSDQVIAPVRETSAQVLGTVLKDMSIENVMKTVDVLLKFVKQKDWEVRHGGLLGLKYLVAVREDLIQDYLPLILNDILAGLNDPEDDVGAVAASSLIPIASHLPQMLNKEQLSHMLTMIWDLLLVTDELTSACNSFMGLLAAILSLPGITSWVQADSLPTLIPRLFPFLSHSSTSVRKSTLQTLKTLTLPVQLPNSDDKDQNSSSTISSIIVTVNGVKLWSSDLLQEALRQIYQRILVEHVEDVQILVEEVWFNIVQNADLSALLHAACPFVTCWLCLAMQPARLAFDQSQLVPVKLTQSKERKGRQSDLMDNVVRLQPKFYLGGVESVPADTRERNVIRARYKASKMIGLLSKYLVLPAPGVTYTPEMESPIQCYTKVLIGYLGSRSALQRIVGGLVVGFWAINDTQVHPGPKDLQEKLKTCLVEYVYYDEVAILFTRLLQEARDFSATLKQHKIQFTELDASQVLTLDQILRLSTSLTDNLKQTYNLKTKIADILEERRRSLHSSYLVTSQEQNTLNTTTQAILSGAIVCLHNLPNEKFAPYVKPLLEAIKRENSEILQKLAAQNLALLIDQVVHKNPCPNCKIITNLCNMLKCDPDFTPQIVSIFIIFIFNVFPKITRSNLLSCFLISFQPPRTKLITDYDSKILNESDPYHGIISLPPISVPTRYNKETHQNGAAPRGRPSVSTIDVPLEDILESNKADATKKQNQIQRKGASYALSHICSHFGKNLPEKLPIVWELLFKFIEENVDSDFVKKCSTTLLDDNDLSTLVNNLHLIETVAPNIHTSLYDKLFELTPKLAIIVSHPYKAVSQLIIDYFFADVQNLSFKF